tara:strand:- start:9 stop:857 length:849 start_codon:yes stop_codon:yes gene_type:complete
MKRFNSSKWITENKHSKNLTEGMSPEEWADAKEKERLNQHPEKDTINKIKKMMDKEKEEMHDDPGDIRIDHDYYTNEDYKPSVRAYNVIDKSNNDEIVAKELPRHKALELAKTNKDYMIDATDRLAETDAIATARSLRPGGEEDEEQEEYDKGWYGESLKEAASKLGYLKEVDGMEGGNMSVSNKFDHSKFDFQEKVIKAEFMYTEQGGRFYSLTLSTSDNRQIKLKHNEANAWLKDTLEYIHEDDLIPRKYISGLEDLDLIVERLKELGIEASHNDFMDVS